MICIYHSTTRGKTSQINIVWKTLNALPISWGNVREREGKGNHQPEMSCEVVVHLPPGSAGVNQLSLIQTGGLIQSSYLDGLPETKMYFDIFKTMRLFIFAFDLYFQSARNNVTTIQSILLINNINVILALARCSSYEKKKVMRLPWSTNFICPSLKNTKYTSFDELFRFRNNDTEEFAMSC